MKAVMVMFDSLNRHFLSPYGCDWTHTPNFARLAERTVRFDKAYVCSMPCMPARRELHTGRPNFLHRSWGPLEPFDDSMPELLKKAGVYTHLATDHYHYFEDGGSTYHGRYNTWELFRGQEGDPWIGQVGEVRIPEMVVPRKDVYGRQDTINRQAMRREADQPQPQTFKAGLDFLRRNHSQDRWFLQIETFDPHEPFFSQRKYKDLFAKHFDAYKGKAFDWPPYRGIEEKPEEIEHLRYEYAALLAMCDAYMGDVLDTFDELDLWKDTMLIVCTDHGFMLGEKDCYAKCWMPFYEEVSHTPLFIWDPRCGKRNESRQSLVQMIDFAPTLLDYFGVKIPRDMTGKSLTATIDRDAKVRDAAIFGMHGGQVNVTDGRHVYMRSQASADWSDLFEYTLMPTHMRSPFQPNEIVGKTDLADALSFTKDCPVLKIRVTGKSWALRSPESMKNAVWDVESDPKQERPVTDPAIEKAMIAHLVREMRAVDAPPEQFKRLGL